MGCCCLVDSRMSCTHLKDAEKMVGSDSEVVSSSGIIERSSPPCLLHELDAPFVEHTEWLTKVTTAHDWEEIHIWRKAKRAALIE